MIKALAAVAVWAVPSAGLGVPSVARDDSALAGSCPSGCYDTLGSQLSAGASIYFPGSAEFNAATLRWSSLANPKVNVVVVPATEQDVSVTVSCPASKSYAKLAKLMSNMTGQIRKQVLSTLPGLQYAACGHYHSWQDGPWH